MKIAAAIESQHRIQIDRLTSLLESQYSIIEIKDEEKAGIFSRIFTVHDPAMQTAIEILEEIKNQTDIDVDILLEATKDPHIVTARRVAVLLLHKRTGLSQEEIASLMNYKTRFTCSMIINKAKGLDVVEPPLDEVVKLALQAFCK